MLMWICTYQHLCLNFQHIYVYRSTSIMYGYMYLHVYNIDCGYVPVNTLWFVLHCNTLQHKPQMWMCRHRYVDVDMYISTHTLPHKPQLFKEALKVQDTATNVQHACNSLQHKPHFFTESLKTLPESASTPCNHS